jgi:predicted metal-dependent phosphoesterase TrpH
VHTCHSIDSLSKPEEVVDAAIRAGLSAVAITDHNEIGGAREAAAIVKERGLPLQVIIGEEVLTDRGDLLVYFVKRKIGMGTLEDALAEAQGQGAACCLPHPYDFARRGINPEKLPAPLLSKIGAIEALNARSSIESQDRAAEKFALEAGKAMLAGSDAHHPSEIGAAFAEFYGVRRLDPRFLLFAKRKLCGGRSSPLVRLHSTYATMRKKTGTWKPGRDTD